MCLNFYKCCWVYRCVNILGFNSIVVRVLEWYVRGFVFEFWFRFDYYFLYIVFGNCLLSKERSKCGFVY